MYKMASRELSTAVSGGDQMEKPLTPSQEDAPPAVSGTAAPLNFLELTPCQFGISVQSFTPVASSNHKDKSRLAQIKARRRSSIGVRGSPETNSLICFMARQRTKTPPTHQTPEHVRNPCPPRVASMLRQKMASFQSLMDVEESESCDPVPRQDSNTGGCIKTRDYLSDVDGTDGGKENHPPTMLTPRKRRRLGPLEGCELQIKEASAPTLHFSLREQEEDKERLPLSEAVEEVSRAAPVSPPLHVDAELQACSPAKNQQDGVFELQSLSRPPPDDPVAAHPASPFSIPSLPSLLEMKPTGEDDSAGTSAFKKKRRVHFGCPLSPEFFDKNLPPSTPLQKGATPARAPTPGGGLRLRPALKTPQRSESQTPPAQPDLSSPTMFGASPTLAVPRSWRMWPEAEHHEEEGEGGQIVFPSMEETDSAVTSDTDYRWDSQPLNLNTAFTEESPSQTATEFETTIITASQMDEPAPVSEKEEQPEAGVEAPAPVTSGNPTKEPEPECESTGEAPARSSSRKRKQPESEPVKRSTRSAAKSASGRMKATSAAARRWNRDVDRSLYGSREYASKNPSLSPIAERLSVISPSAAAQQTPSASCTGHAAPNPETHSNPELDHDTRAVRELTVTQASENPSGDSITSATSSKESTPRKSRRVSGQRVRGRGLKKRKVSVANCDQLSEEAQDQTGGQTEEHREDQTTTAASGEAPLNCTLPEQGGAGVEPKPPTSADTPSTDSDGRSERHANLNADPPSSEDLSHALGPPVEVAQSKAKQGGGSLVSSSVLQEQGDQVEEHQMSHKVEDGRGEQAASSDSQEEEAAADLDLAPWQADFNFEDVFKPVATRGQRSVRRSLRNQGNAVVCSSNGAGLAWLPRTSPESSKEARRKTRGRRPSAAPPVPPPVSEETQDNAS